MKRGSDKADTIIRYIWRLRQIRSTELPPKFLPHGLFLQARSLRSKGAYKKSDTFFIHIWRLIDCGSHYFFTDGSSNMRVLYSMSITSFFRVYNSELGFWFGLVLGLLQTLSLHLCPTNSRCIQTVSRFQNQILGQSVGPYIERLADFSRLIWKTYAIRQCQ
jgi:hypothetical protein